MRPLEGLRILDLTRVLSGPFATALLADLGAKIMDLGSPYQRNLTEGQRMQQAMDNMAMLMAKLSGAVAK